MKPDDDDDATPVADEAKRFPSAKAIVELEALAKKKPTKDREISAWRNHSHLCRTKQGP